MTSTSRKPRVVSSPTPRALRSITTFEPSVVPCTAWATSPQATPLAAISASRPARHASDGSGYVVSRFAVASSPEGDCSTKSVKVPPTSKPMRYATRRSAPAVGAREDDAVRVALAHLVRDRVLDGLAAGREIGALEEQERRARPDLEQLGDLPWCECGIHHLLHQLDLDAGEALDGADERRLGQVLVGERRADRERHVRGDVLKRAGLAQTHADDAVRGRARRKPERLRDVRRQHHDV